MSETIVIDRRFRGPPASANGGYACGVVGELVGTTAESTLRAPPPLDVPLDVVRGEAGGVLLRHGDVVIAEGKSTTLELDVPAPVDFETALVASRSYPWFTGHPFPMCFVCGHERAEGDGLRIFPGTVPDRDLVAAPWIPDPSLGDAQGRVLPVFLWAALDCPSWFGFYRGQPLDGGVLLGRLSATFDQRPHVGERCVTLGWFLGIEGRKITCASAILSESGAVLARARATWVTLAR